MRIAEIQQSLSLTDGQTKYSDTVDITHCLGFSADAVWSASGATGDVTLQSSNDGVNFYDIADADEAISGNGSNFWNYFYFANFRYLRLRCTCASNAIVINFNIVAKGF
jgi:hypothetical protein